MFCFVGVWVAPHGSVHTVCVVDGDAVGIAAAAVEVSPFAALFGAACSEEPLFAGEAVRSADTSGGTTGVRPSVCDAEAAAVPPEAAFRRAPRAPSNAAHPQ